jgi:hypothetical protein
MQQGDTLTFSSIVLMPEPNPKLANLKAICDHDARLLERVSFKTILAMTVATPASVFQTYDSNKLGSITQ